MGLRKTIYGRQKAKVNTYIGGIGGTINTPALLANKLGIAENRIKLFKVTGVDVECAIIGGSYQLINRFANDSSITYFNDESGLVTYLKSSFNGNTGNIKYLLFPNVSFIEGGTGGGWLARNTSSMIRCYMPRCAKIGSTALMDEVFRAGFNWSQILYVNSTNQTIDNGNPDGDLIRYISNGGQVRYVTNFTPPNTITNLSSGTIYNTAIQLNFTSPSSTNGIDFYEVYINGEKFNSKEIKNSGDFITGLLPNTTYKIEVKAVDIFYNKSVFSNAVNVTTTNTVLDVDANAYMIVSGNEIWQPAINSLFTDLKSQGLYAKIQAFYPFLGTTQAQHKWNGKNPLDTNAAFRLQFFGGGTHSNLGYQCNGTNAYANTFLVPSSVQNVNSNGLTVTVGTNNIPSAACVEIAAYNSETQMSYLQVKDNSANERHASILNSRTGQAISGSGSKDSKGIYTGVKVSATSNKLFKNKVNIFNGTGGGTLPSVSFGIGGFFNGGTYTPQRIQFTAIHEGLTDAEVVALHTIIDNFEAAIGRKTW